METSTKEARRRRIVDRGEDRLALITGRIKTLDSTSSPLPSPLPSQSELGTQPQIQPHHTHTFSSPPLLCRQDQIQSNYRAVRTFVDPDDDIDENDGENDVSSNLTSKPETGNVFINSGDQVEPQLRKCETNVEKIRSPPVDISSENQPKLILPTVKEDSSNSKPSVSKPLSRAEPRSHHSKLFTPKRISSSITASENVRLLCSITIALLVVLSHLSSSVFLKNFLLSSPLYLVLLSDFTIVVARLLFGERGSFVKAEEEATKPPSEEPNGISSSDSNINRAMNVGKALETGMVMFKAFKAVFMDCSVYAVVVICGLSLIQYSSI